MARPYGAEHRELREFYRPRVDAGQAWCTEVECVMPDRWIRPGTPWDLAHDRSTGGYLGPAHASCNRREGAAYGNATRAAEPNDTTPWSSRNWFG